MRGGTTNKKRKLNTCFEAYFYSQHPSEIWQMIVSFVSIYTLPILATTCSQFHDIIIHSRYSTLIVAKMYRQIGQIHLAYRCLMHCINLKNDAEAMFELGYAYRYYGWGIQEMSEKKATHWFQRSAKADNARGMAFYAFCLKYGYGVERSEHLSKIWAKQALGLGKEDPFVVGFCHYWDLGMMSTSEHAFKFFEKSKDEHAYYYLAKYYSLDMLLSTHSQKMFLKFCSKAAELGLCPAQSTLAKHLRKNIEIKKKDEANIWNKKAAAQGDQEALNFIHFY